MGTQAGCRCHGKVKNSAPDLQRIPFTERCNDNVFALFMHSLRDTVTPCHHVLTMVIRQQYQYYGDPIRLLCRLVKRDRQAFEAEEKTSLE